MLHNCIGGVHGAHMMASVEERIRAGGLISGANTSLLEGMKFLKEMQDQSGLFPFIKIFLKKKSIFSPYFLTFEVSLLIIGLEFWLMKFGTAKG